MKQMDFSDGYPASLYAGGPPHRGDLMSREAAGSIDANTLRARVRAAIAASRDGLTDDEIEITTGLIHQTASARRRELVLLGQVIDTGRTRPTRSGRRAHVWKIAGRR